MAKTVRRRNPYDGFDDPFDSPSARSHIHGCDDEVKPPAGYCHYSNPSCQSTLLRASEKWTRKIPEGHTVSSSYVDRMYGWDSEKYERSMKLLQSDRDLNTAVRHATEENLLAMARCYFGPKVIAVRWVYFYNVSSGYCCQRIDTISEK